MVGIQVYMEEMYEAYIIICRTEGAMDAKERETEPKLKQIK